MPGLQVYNPSHVIHKVLSLVISETLFYPSAIIKLATAATATAAAAAAAARIALSTSEKIRYLLMKKRAAKMCTV